MTASAPSTSACETATVMPRSLKLPVGFVSSSFSSTSTPSRSEILGAGTSGVEPSPIATTSPPGASGRRSRKRSITPTLCRSMPAATATILLAVGARAAHPLSGDGPG